MLVTGIWCWWLALDVGDVTCHQHPKLVIYTFGPQHPSPTLNRLAIIWYNSEIAKMAKSSWQKWQRRLATLIYLYLVGVFLEIPIRPYLTFMVKIEWLSLSGYSEKTKIFFQTIMILLSFNLTNYPQKGHGQIWLWMQMSNFSKGRVGRTGARMDRHRVWWTTNWTILLEKSKILLEVSKQIPKWRVSFEFRPYSQ